MVQILQPQTAGWKPPLGVRFTCVPGTELFAAARVKNTRIRMAAAGHYIQDLQYRYLRTLLESFLADRSEPQPLARTAVVTSAA